MNLQFTKEEVLLKKKVQDFAMNEITPQVWKMETGWFPSDILKKMGKCGFMGLTVPKKYGGQGLDFTAYIMMVHEISKISPVLGVILSVHSSVGTNPILYFGTEKQKDKYLPKLASGKYLGAFCLTEENAGSDARHIRTKATKDGEHYILNGSKMFVTNGGEADTYIAFATLADRGITAFIVEKGTPGLIFGKDEKKMGLHGSRTVQLMFDHMKIPSENRLGEEGEGFSIAMANLEAGRIGIAAQALGIAEGAFAAALQYVNQQHSVAKSTSNLQNTYFTLAEMATKIEAAKLLVYRASDMRKRGLSCRQEAAMAKLFASQTAVDVASDVVQLLGEYGYTEESGAERYFRDAKITQIYEGTSEIQKIVISKQL